jgi:excinuclease ABC subunit B
MEYALSETERRREKQMAYNVANGIVPRTVTKAIFAEVGDRQEKTDKSRKFVYDKSGGVMDADSIRREIKSLTRQMHQAAEDLEFERAAQIRDTIHKLEDDLLLVE